MLSWDLEVKVGGVERALLHSLTQVLPWSPFSRLTEGLETEGFAFLWSMPSPQNGKNSLTCFKTRSEELLFAMWK